MRWYSHTEGGLALLAIVREVCIRPRLLAFILEMEEKDAVVQYL
jgi:hypothetical protein